MIGNTAAYYLAKAGHQVTVIDSNRRAFDRLSGVQPAVRSGSQVLARRGT